MPRSAGGTWSGRMGAGARVSVRRRSKAAVMAQMATAAKTSTVWRAIAVQSRTWDWSSPSSVKIGTGYARSLPPKAFE